MIKLRYFQVRFPFSLEEFGERVKQSQSNDALPIVKVLEANTKELIYQYTIEKDLTKREILLDGSEIISSIKTMERYLFRFFERGEKIYMCLIDPPRGLKFISEMFENTFGLETYFFEALEFSANFVNSHISKFPASKLISAKIRDFQIYDGAVGRLEIVSREGLQADIAPFLVGKFYQIDSFTYEVFENFASGSICYMRNGTIKVVGQSMEKLFSSLEQILD